jgi:hypothetical protein
VARFTALGAKPIQSEQNFNVGHLPSEVNEFVDSTVPEVLELNLKRVEFELLKVKSSMGMKHDNLEQNVVLSLPN